MQQYSGNVVNATGLQAAGAPVTVYFTGTTTKPTIYSDNGTTAASNPLTSDANGNFTFYAANGVYDLSYGISQGSFAGPATVTLNDPTETKSARVRLDTAAALVTTAQNGAFEYDGKAFYQTPNASNRAVTAAKHIVALTTALTCLNTSVAQAVFKSPTNGTITLPAAASYRFRGLYHIVRSAGAVTHTTSVLFGGGATLTSIMYRAVAHTATGNVLTATSSIVGAAASAVAVTATSISTTENVVIELNGIVRVNAAGTFIPQFKFSAAPGGAPVVQANSFFELEPIGSNTVGSVGNWS